MDTTLSIIGGLGRQITSLPAKVSRALPVKVARSPSTELISGDGEFNEAVFKDFLNSIKFHQCGSSYAVVAIVGPQSSGKSTLMNHLFNTNFREMNANTGRSQTTKGIWIAKAPAMEPLTMVLDIEGTDGLERGEDGTAFEKQSALWCHDIGRDQAANRPLFKTIFEVMMRLFPPHKTTLLFVIRDKTKTPFERLERKLREDVEKIWEAVPKPQDRQKTPLTGVFNVEVIALSHYEYAPDIFKKEVADLKLRYFHSISPRRLVGEREELPFSMANNIWEVIKENKDLNLPLHKVMVATVRCEEIAMEKLSFFESDKERLALQRAVETRLVSGLSAKISSILDRYLSKYDSECIYFDENVRKEKRKYLMSEALKLVHPAYIKTLGHLRSEALRSFETQLEAFLSEGAGFAESVRTCKNSSMLEFDKGCSGAAFSDHFAIGQADASAVREQLVRDTVTHSLLVRTKKLPQIEEQQRERVSATLTKKLRFTLLQFNDDEDDKWASIRSLLKSESDAAASALSSAVAMFELDQEEVGKMVHDIKLCARNLMVAKFKEETRESNVLTLMNQRYVLALEKETKEEPNEVSIETKEKLDRECLKLLSTLAVIRLDEINDNVESVLLSLSEADHLDSMTEWEGVPPEMTSIKPDKCRDIWINFKMDIESVFTELGAAGTAVKDKQLPLWAIVGLKILKYSGFIFFTQFFNVDVTLLKALVDEGEPILTRVAVEYRDFYVDIKKKTSTWIRRNYRQMMTTLKKVLKKIYNRLIAPAGRKISITNGAYQILQS